MPPKPVLLNTKTGLMAIVSKCVICKVIQVKTLLPPSTAELPDYRVYFEFPFKNVGLDYAGPL